MALRLPPRPPPAPPHPAPRCPLPQVIRQQIAEKHGAEAAAKIDPSMLEAFANQQMVDITAVQPGTKANGFTGVSF